MKTTFFKIAIMSVILWSCGNNQKTEDTVSSAATETTFKNVDPALTSQINKVVQHYIHLKNGLVASNMDEAKAGAKGILDAVNAMDTTKLTAEQKVTFDEQIGKIKENARHILETDQLEHQREHLNVLTEGVYAITKDFGSGKTLYYEFCPMANDNKGGYWISESEEIKNPYFGDEMLNCGEVKETIK